MRYLILFLSVFAARAAAQDIEIDIGPAHVEQTENVYNLPGRALMAPASPHAEDVLRAVPGVVISKSGGAGQPSFLLIRGADAGGTLVLLDGIPLNDPSLNNKAYDFSAIDLNQLERIEVWKGPQSVLFGSGATGGAVNLISKKGRGSLKTTLNGEVGSYNSSKLGAFAQGSVAAVGYTMSVQQSRSDGISAASGGTEADGSFSGHYSGRADWKLTEKTELKITGRYSEQSSDTDFAPMSSAPFIEADAPNSSGSAKSSLISIGAGHEWTRGLDSEFTVSRRGQDRRYRNDPDAVNPSWLRSHYTGEVYRASNTNAWRGGLNHVALCPFYETESAASEYLSDSSNSFAPRSTVATWGAAIRAGTDHQYYFATVGARADRHSRFGAQTAFELAPGVHLPYGADVTARYATAYKAPTLVELYDPQFGNPELQPDIVRGGELTYEQKIPNAGLQLTLFQSNYGNLIQFAGGRYSNINSAYSKGIETAITVGGDVWSWRAAYTYLETRDNSTGESLPRRPRNSISSRLEGRFPLAFTARLEYLGADSRIDIDPISGARVLDSGYGVFNARVDWQPTTNLMLYLTLVNLLDLKYEEVAGYGTYRRSAFLGASLKL